MAASALCATLLGTPALAASGRGSVPARTATPVRLRLDDSPSLVLLRPFRHAAGRNPSALARYREGAFSGWLHRAWRTLDWLQILPDTGSPRPAAMPVNPGLVGPQAARSACLERLAGVATGWPATTTAAQWIADSPTDPLGLFCEQADELDDFALHSRWVPPWLRSVAAGWAGTLLLTTGCGPASACSPGVRYPAAAFAALWPVLAPPRREPPYWVCRERPVKLMRAGREQQTLLPLRCDGSIPSEALERLSVLARPAGAAIPPAAAGALHGRTAGDAPSSKLRLLHPRLMWVLHRVTLAFPWHAIFIYSGYRLPKPGSRARGHGSQHWRGRALDLSVQDASLEDLLALCAELNDVACGYYPNSKFVHFDVRSRGRGTGLWVDTAAPGEPSHYVSSWPGVVKDGRVIWQRPATWSTRPARTGGRSSDPRR